MNQMEATAVNFKGLIQILVAPETSDQARWLTRLTLLQLAGVDATPEAMAFIANTTVAKAAGAMAVLVTSGHVQFQEDSPHG